MKRIPFDHAHKIEILRVLHADVYIPMRLLRLNIVLKSEFLRRLELLHRPPDNERSK